MAALDLRLVLRCARSRRRPRGDARRPARRARHARARAAQAAARRRVRARRPRSRCSGSIVPAIVLSSDQASAGPGGTKLSAEPAGRPRAVQPASARPATRSSDAGAVGRVGPDLDVLAPTAGPDGQRDQGRPRPGPGSDAGPAARRRGRQARGGVHRRSRRPVTAPHSNACGRGCRLRNDPRASPYGVGCAVAARPFRMPGPTRPGQPGRSRCPRRA